MVVGEASIHNIMGGMESTGGVRLHNHKRKLKQRFDIIKKLGQGTYGKVQLGINKETGQEVAIKTIKKCKIETEADLIRIRREIQIMSSVQHPNIIHIYEVFENREKMVLVMEYAAGGELYDYLSERKVLSEHEARRIFRQISTAVFYCHKHKICHRDLKLENILLDQIGNAKIADFGLSNVFDEQRLLSTFCGSPLYASPEIVKGTPYHGPEVDCWSLGVLLYTLVYGAMPFDGSNFKRLVKQISQSDYFEPKKPSPASPLIRDMLTVCPTRRADVEKICTHWWVNEGFEQNCLDIAEDLAAQTPVRLDLLLSLVPQSASAEKLVVGDQQAGGDVANNMSSETLVPTRCHSVGSLMELDQNNSDRRIREMTEEEPRTTAAGDAKRKLETTPSMDETAAAGIKRKERSRRKERTVDRDPRQYRSGSRHHSAPIPNPITEEAMEIEPTAVVTVPTSKTVDLNKLEGAAASLALIEESKEKSPSKERSKTPVASEQPIEDLPLYAIPTENVAQVVSDAKTDEIKVLADEGREKSPKFQRKETTEQTQRSPERKRNVKKTTADTPKEVKEDTSKSDVPKEIEETVPEAKTEVASVEIPMPKDTDITNGAFKDDKTNIKKLKKKAMSLDSELSNDAPEVPLKPVERRRSKIFETAERFNQMAAAAENEKPKKIFIPGVNVGGAKRAFERKASLSTITIPQTVKPCASKVIIEVPADKTDKKVDEKSKESENSETSNKSEKSNKHDEEKKRAVDIITGAIGKPPVQKKANGSPPTSPQSHDSKKLGLKLQVGPNDVRFATVSVSTPVDTKFPFESKPALHAEAAPGPVESSSTGNSVSDEPKKSSKMEITLKSATLPRPRKTSKAEITLAGVKSPENTAFKSEVEAKIDAFHPQKLRTQRSEVAFPVAAAVPQANRCSSLEPEGKNKNLPKERIIPIQVESSRQQTQHASTPPPKPPMPQRSMSQRSGSLSRQSTVESDTDSALGSTAGPEPIRKSPREYIIPIAVEGGGYVTPRSGSVEPESKTSTPTSTTAPRARFTRPRRMSSLLSDASEDESPFSTLHRDSDDLLQRHMHRLRSSRPTRQAPEHTDSLSSGEDDDDDGFELLTAENLFSTLLSRVRSLTQRLNVDDNRGSSFPSSRLLGRLGSNSPQGFWGIHEPLSRRLSESQFRRSLSRDTDRFGHKEPASPGTPNSPGPRSTPSRDSLFEMGSNTLPRDKVQHENTEDEASQFQKQAQETLEQSFTPSLARRLSRQFIEQTRQSLPRSPSILRDQNYQSPTQQNLNSMDDGCDIENQNPSSTTSDQTEYRGRSAERNIRRSNSLLEPRDKFERFDRRSPRRSVSLFDDEDKLLPPLPRQVMTLGRKYRDAGKTNTAGMRRENFHNYKNDKIQEESADDWNFPKINVENVGGNNIENGSPSECNSESVGNSNTNLIDTASSVSVKSNETSPTESTSNMLDYNCSYKSDTSRDFENRLLAAEKLIKESKLKNLGPSKYDINLSSSYRDTDKCDKESLESISEASTIGRRRSYIPSLRMRSGSLTRDPVESKDRRMSFTGSQDVLRIRSPTPERSILSKFFKPNSGKDGESKEKQVKHSGQRRISRFLRPDFFDTPREESQYVKEKEAQKAAENERRKSRFSKKKNDKESSTEKNAEGKPSKELKNETNSITKEKSEISSKDDQSERDVSSISEDSKPKFERQSSKNSFLHSLEKKLERFRSSDESSKSITNNGRLIDQKIRSLRENSAPPEDSLCTESGLIKRAVSVEDLALQSVPLNPPRSKVTSVLGLFKHIDSKPGGQRPQSTLLSKLKKSSYKGSKSDTTMETDIPSTSKIPTKFMKCDTKSSKKSVEERNSPGKGTDSKKSPPKEKLEENIKGTPERMNLGDAKKLSPEKILKESKKSSPEKVLIESRKFSPEKVIKECRKLTPEKVTERKIDNSYKLTDRRNGLQDKVTEKANGSPEKIIVTNKSSTPEKGMDNNSTISNKLVGKKNVESEEKKAEKPKKNTSSLTSIVKNGSVKNVDKGEDIEKKVKKVIKIKESTEKEPGDGTKKKKIIRVVKKVVRKSTDSSDSKSDSKSSKTVGKKSSSAIAEKSPDTQASNSVNRVKESSPKNKTDINVPKIDPPKEAKSSSTGNEKNMGSTIVTTKRKDSELKQCLDAKTNKYDCNAPTIPELKSDKLVEDEIKSNRFDSTVGLPKSLESRGNRNNLKLDLSKIPQHTFRNMQPVKKDMTKSDTLKTESTVSDTELSKISPKVVTSKSGDDAAKLIKNLSKMTHHANITGNKIIIDKPLCANDVADLQKVANDSLTREDEKVSVETVIQDKVVEISEVPVATQNNVDDIEPIESKPITPPLSDVTYVHRLSNNIPNILDAQDTEANADHQVSNDASPPKGSPNLNLPLFNPNPIPPPKESPNDHNDDMFSPVDDTESFDSWSICSADMNHTRGELLSPTSPTYSPSVRNDQPESIIDRIRRKSFYSRFNDRKRKTSLTAPPPGVTLPVSATLPRKFSFNRPRERDLDKLTSYVSPAKRYPERSRSLYNEDAPSYRKSSVDRDRYSDIGVASSYRKSPVDRDRYPEIGATSSYSNDLRSPIEHYGNLSSSYDALRKYVRSPTLDSSSIRRKYHSSDFGTDNDLSSYKSPLSGSLLNDSPLESYSSRSTGALPRKYGSTVSSSEPKTAEYYEELLAPSKSDYLTTKKSPTSGDYVSRYENGYHNGNLDLPQYKVEKWKNYSDKMAGMDLTESNDGGLVDQIRGKSRSISQSKELPSTSPEPQPSTSPAE